MYVPDMYREPNGDWLIKLIRENPLALLVVNGEPGGEPYATHLPVIPDPQMTGDWAEDLAGGSLIGHMNRANPHWSALVDGDPVLLVFTGPHAYVSPTVYEVTPAAPTWNFTAVHVHGTVRRLPAGEDTLNVVKATVSAFEARFGTGWDMAASIPYFREILPAVGAFHITITKAEGMFKLSQEQPCEVRSRVLRHFSERTCTRHRATAALMANISSG